MSSNSPASRPWWEGYWPIDVIAGGFAALYALLAGLAARAHPSTGWRLMIEFLVCGALFAAMPLVLRALTKRFIPGVQFIVRWQLVMVTMTLGFMSMGPILPAIRPGSWEAMLADADLRLLGFHPSEYFAAHMHPLATDVLQLLYVVYYFFYYVIVVAPYRRGDYRGASRAMALAGAALFTNFTAYIFLPARSPWMTNEWPEASWLADLPRYLQPLEGSALFRFLNHVIAAAPPNVLDLFPSGHIGNTAAVVWFTARYERRWFPWMAVYLGVLMVATLYLRYHYVVDFFGGFIYAILVNGCVIRFEAWWVDRSSRGATATIRETPRSGDSPLPASPS